MELVSTINNAQTIEDLNNVLNSLKTTQHALTSKEELNSYLQTKVKELGATYDKEAKCYISVE